MNIIDANKKSIMTNISKTTEVIKVHKKRGRKKKIKTAEEIEREKNKPKQRRGRKPKSELKNIEKKDITELINKNNNIKDTVILNLDIKNNKCNNNIEKKNFENEYMSYDPVITEPVGYDLESNYTSNPELFKNNLNEIKNKNTKKHIYNNLEEFISNKNWNKQTNTCCFWCCHQFNNIPFGLPIKYKDNKFYVNGCFCSLECAAAYNFSEDKIIQDSWECYNLINLLSHKINYKNIVKLAPDRKSLKIFGGKMTIDEFRKFINSDKVTNTLEYPMIAVTQQIEEINYNYNNISDSNYIPIDNERIKKLEQKIQLRRNKPLLNNKNTLEHTMNIKINN